MRLVSYDFKTAKGFYPIASVKVNLSNEESSSIFEKEGVQFDHAKTIPFDPNRPIRSIVGQSGYGGQFARTIRFRDKDDVEI